MVCQNLKNNRVGVIDLNNIFLKITDLPVKRVKFTTEKPDRNRLISVAIVSINKSSTDFNFCFFFSSCVLRLSVNEIRLLGILQPIFWFRFFSSGIPITYESKITHGEGGNIEPNNIWKNGSFWWYLWGTVIHRWVFNICRYFWDIKIFPKFS